MATVTETLAPTDAEVQLARASSARLAKYLASSQQSIRIQPEEETGEVIVVPMAAFRAMAAVLHEMAQGNAVTLIPVNAELTTQQAADLLNVSRPFLIEQLEKKLIPYHKTGTHRRILAADVRAYKERIDRERRKVLAELVGEAQELGMGY